MLYLLCNLTSFFYVSSCEIDKAMFNDELEKAKVRTKHWNVWSKVVQHATTSNEGNQRPKYLQNRTLYFLQFQLCYAHLFFSFQNRRFSICISFSFGKKEKPSVLKLKLKVFIKVLIKFENRSMLQFRGHSFKTSTNFYYFWPLPPSLQPFGRTLTYH